MRALRIPAVVVFCALLLCPASGRAEEEPAAPTPREQVFAAADQYADTLLAAPPDGLTRGEIALAFGWIHMNGMLGEPAYAKAAGYLEKALEEGEAEAGVLLGALAYNAPTFGLGERDMTKAVGYYQKAADAGCVDAFRTLGIFHSEGEEGLEADADKGRGYLLEAARRGSDTAIRRLEPLLGQHGLPAAADDLVDAGLAAAAQERTAHLSRVYAKVAKLLEARLEELELAISRPGSEGLEAVLAGMSPAERERYWERLDQATEDACQAILAEQPDAKAAGEAALIMGILNHLDILHGSTPAKALRYMEYALERGVPEAAVTLGEFHLGLIKGDDDDDDDAEEEALRDPAKGLEYLAKASDEDNPNALRIMGILYTNGAEGVAPDAELAESYFMKAARHGDEESLERLEPLYERIKALPPDERNGKPAGPDESVVPALAEAAAARSEELSKVAEKTHREILDRAARLLAQ